MNIAMLHRMAIATFMVVTLSMAAPVTADTLQKIKQSGTIVVGHRESSIPFSYLDENKQPLGYSMEICGKVVDALKSSLKLPNLKVQYKLVTSVDRIPLVKEGSVDLECGSTTNNLERQKEVTFSVTTFVAANRMVAKKSSKVRTLLDLKGKPVVSTKGTTSLKLLIEINDRDNFHMNILQAKDHAEAFAMVEDGRAAAFMMDDILLASFIAHAKSPSDYALMTQIHSVEPYGIMMRRDDPEFKKLVDGTVVSLFKSGEIKKIYSKWFLSPIPVKGINLNIPMGEVLKKVIAIPTDSGNPAHYY